MAATRLRKAFKHPGEGSDGDDLPDYMDEEGVYNEWDREI